MDRRILKRPLYHIAGRLSKLLKNFQKFQDEKLKMKADNKWDTLFNGNESFVFTYNTIKVNLYKDSVLSRIIYEGFEKAEIDYVSSNLKEGDIFIDVGANIGLFSLIASKIVGEEGKVICFEPSPITYFRLKENVDLNGFKNIDCRNIGLSDAPKELTFYISNKGYDAWNSFAPSQDDKLNDKIKVPVSTLEIQLNTINKELIRLVKIDVEGWEKFVLNGGSQFFVDYKPIVMVEFTEENTFNAGYSVYDIYDIMQNWGYVWYRIVNGKMIEEIKQMRYPYVNLIAIKP